MSDWSNTIKYINSFSHNEIITPKMVKDEINNKDTIALYVNYLHKAGFLKRTSRGIYRRVQNIPSNLTLTQLRTFAYPNGATCDDRKKNVERYWKLHNIRENINI